VATGADYYVNNQTGEDANHGTAPDAAFRTIGRINSRLQPGDTLHLAATGTPYYESIAFSNLSGREDAWITVDGHGAVLDASDPLDPTQWTPVASGLYKNEKIYPEQRWNKDYMTRFFMVMDGKLNSMNRCMKGFNAPLKKPEDLLEKEWTLSDDATVIFLKIDPAKKLEDYDIRLPVRINGVSIHNQSDYILVKNITATHPFNDGFSMSGTGTHLRLENIRAIDCGDDGISAHGEQQYHVDGYYASGNGTGICDTGDTRTTYENVVIENIRGVEIYFLQNLKSAAHHGLANAVIRANGDKQILLQNAAGGTMTIDFDNVLFIGKTGPGKIDGDKANSDDPYLRCGDLAFAVSNSSILNMDWSMQGDLSLSGSFVTGRKEGINFYKAAEDHYRSVGNAFGVKVIRFGKDFYYPGLKPAETEKYVALTQDKDSVYLPVTEAAGLLYVERDGKRYGADVEKFTNEAYKEMARALLP